MPLADEPQRPGWRWHALALVGFGAMAPLVMRAWLGPDLLPTGDFAGYAAEVEYVRAALARHDSLPSWTADRFAGTTRFVSSVKELVTFPLAAAVGAVTATKLMFLFTKVLAALGLYAICVRYLASPAAGMIAGYAYAFGSAANLQTAFGGHLDIAMSAALFPPILIASVELLRAGRMAPAVALGALVAFVFSASYPQAIVCPVIFVAALALRPWRMTADGPPAEAGLARGSLARAAAALAVFLALAASQLVWLAADLRHHALHSAETLAEGLRVFVELSPLMFVNRSDWLGAWLAEHRPPGLVLFPDDPLFNQRRYLGLVALGVVLAGWFPARRHHALRRWYQLFALLFLFQYWLSIGPGTLVWQIAHTMHWPEATIAPIRVVLGAIGLACFGWAAVLASRRRRGGPEASSWPRVELALGSGLVLVFVSSSLFEVFRTVLPLLRGMRAPGHFFDLAPFSFYGLLAVGIAAFERALPRRRLRGGLALVLGLLVVLDFWPSHAGFERGTSLESVREFRARVADLPGEAGTLRIATDPWHDPPHPSLLTAGAAAGSAWTWLDWQAGRDWRPYMEGAMAWTVPGLDASRRERLRPAGAALGQLARIKYILEDLRLPRLELQAPWELRAENGDFALWEGPAVLPMASAYRGYALSVGGSDWTDALLVADVLARGVLVVAGERRLADSAEDVIREAAIVVCRGPVALADAASRALADRHAPACAEPLARRWSAFLAGTAPRAPLPVRYQRPRPEVISLDVDAEAAPATVLVSEAYHPWWRATVDGRATPVLRAQIALMAVPVMPGRHRVELHFRPPLVVALADWLTTASWAALAVAVPLGAFATSRRRRARAR
jgi:hypothetical protein